MRLPPIPALARIFRLAAPALSAAVLAGCIIGGTGTDTENGVAMKDYNVNAEKSEVSFRGVSARVVDGDGRPIKDVALVFHPPGFRPDSGLAVASLLAAGSKKPITDADGLVHVDLAAAGKFVVEGVLSGQTLFYDTLAVPDTRSAALFTFRTRPGKAFTGRVRLASGMRIDSGSVFIRGTARWDKLDSAGNYDLGVLPADADRMALGVRYAASPISVKEVTGIDTTQRTVSLNDTAHDADPVYTCKDLTADSAQNVLAAAGANAGAADGAGSAGGSDTVTAKVNAAVQSCDSLSGGTVVNVKPVENKAGSAVGNQDTASVPVLVVGSASSSLVISKEVVVVPYGECLASTGAESTVYAVEVRTTASGSDLLVGDVAEKCLEP